VLKFTEKRALAIEFMKLLATGHQCMAESKVKDGVKEIFYQGPSPDEVTLVEMAQMHGYEFSEGTDSKAVVKVKKPLNRDVDGVVEKWEHSRQIEFEVFRRIEFNSDRKRMSIVLRDPEDGHYKLYCKGADSIIKERLDEEAIDLDMMEKVDEFLLKASEKGFRTLLMAMKVLTKEEVDQF